MIDGETGDEVHKDMGLRGVKKVKRGYEGL
jgi:hypothetical protein